MMHIIVDLTNWRQFFYDKLRHNIVKVAVEPRA